MVPLEYSMNISKRHTLKKRGNMDEDVNDILDIQENIILDNAPVINIEELVNSKPRRITRVYKYSEEYDYSNHT